MAKYLPNGTVKIGSNTVNGDLYEEALLALCREDKKGASIIVTERFVIFVGNCVVPVEEFYSELNIYKRQEGI